MGTEDNNTPKVNVRSIEAKVINDHFKEREVSMLELLGSGVGLEYYARNCNCINEIVAAEKDADKFLSWQENKDELIRSLYESGRDVAIEAFNCDLNELLTEASKCSESWDILNLDFCSFFYLQGKTTYAPGEILELIFDKALIRSNGMIFTTFMVDGWRVRQFKNKMPSMILDPEEIKRVIVSIGKRLGYTILPINEIEVYRSSHASTMMWTGFVVT